MANKIRRLGVVGFLVGLVLVQVIAFAFQFKSGFRPFLQEPIRVPFSWDMFSIPVERCVIEWDPPLSGGKRVIRRFHDLGLPFEWEPVYNKTEDYHSAGFQFCSLWGTKQTRMKEKCFLRDGTVRENESNCD